DYFPVDSGGLRNEPRALRPRTHRDFARRAEVAANPLGNSMAAQAPRFWPRTPGGRRYDGNPEASWTITRELCWRSHETCTNARRKGRSPNSGYLGARRRGARLSVPPPASAALPHRVGEQPAAGDLATRRRADQGPGRVQRRGLRRRIRRTPLHDARS